MLKILVLICVLASLLVSVMLVSWLRSKRGHGERIARLYLILKSRNSNFRLSQLPHVIIMAVILFVVTGMGTDWYNAAAYAAGVIVSLAAVFLTSSLYSTGSCSSANMADLNDAPVSLKCSYRTGAAIGFVLSAVGLLLLCLFFLNLKTDDITLTDYIAPLALGVSTTALYLHTGGYVYSSAYVMAEDDKDFRDSTGFLYGSAADMLESYIIAAAAAVMLADLAVATSGITSTFTSESAAKYPVVIYAAGTAASVLSTLVFRSGTQRRPQGSAALTCILSGIMTAAVSLYFSMEMLQSMVYSFAVITGIAAGLILGEFSQMFSSDSKMMIANKKNDRRLGRHAQVVFNLGAGMTSSAFFAVIFAAALAVAFNYASYYGIALCAVGFCSIAPSVSAVSGLSIMSGTASEILTSDSFAVEEAAVKSEGESTDINIVNEISDVLATASVRTRSISRSYTTSAAFLASAAMLAAIFYQSEYGSINLISEKSISLVLGAMGGAASVLVLFGLILLAIRFSGYVALRSLSKTDDEGATGSLRGSVIPSVLAIAFPACIGLFFGFRILCGFLFGATCTGFLFIYAVNNSGRHFENTAVKSLCSLIKLMVVFSAVFMPAIINIGGFIH